LIYVLIFTQKDIEQKLI